MSTMGKPDIEQRRCLARSRLFAIESLELAFSNGEKRCFERVTGNGQGAGAVMIVALPDPNHVLLIREYAAGIEEYALGLPKGVIDPGEDMITAANRELREECGFGAQNIEPLIELTLAPHYMTHRIQVVMATGLYVAPLEGDEPEPLQVERVPIDDISALLARGDFHEGRAIAALFIAREKLRERRIGPDPLFW